MVDAIESNPRYAYVKRLADDTQKRAKGFHFEYQEYDGLANNAARFGDSELEKFFRGKANAKLNDFFYWIGHSNAYRGIALQVDFMETVEAEEDAEPSCP